MTPKPYIMVSLHFQAGAFHIFPFLNVSVKRVVDKTLDLHVLVLLPRLSPKLANKAMVLGF